MTIEEHVDFHLRMAYGDRDLALTRLEEGLQKFQAAPQTPKVKARVASIKARTNYLKKHHEEN